MDDARVYREKRRPRATRGAAHSLVGALLAIGASWLLSGSLRAAEGPAPERADRAVVYKADRSLLLLRRGRVLRAYRVALGSAPDGPKRGVGDGRTPEGAYVLDWRTDRSRYYRAIHISYPNAADRARSVAMGLQPGGNIMIHGLPRHLATIGSSHAGGDWTSGCIAVTNREMEEIWRLVADGTPIEIRP
jgi:murein L,D-transpeptidase YafK